MFRRVSACFGIVSAFFAKSPMFMRVVSAFRRLTPFFDPGSNGVTRNPLQCSARWAWAIER